MWSRKRQPVGAGDRHARLLERADDQLLHDAAPAEQDQDVAGLDRLPRARQTLAARRASAGSCPRCARATRRSGSSLGRGASGSGQGSSRRSARPAPPAATARPGPAGWRARSRGAGRSSGSTTPPAPPAGRTRRRPAASTAGTERNERSSSSARIGRRAARARAAQLVPDAAEIGEVGTLEAVDRLLLVADHEQRALAARARPAPAKSSSVSLSDDPPLPRAGVLRLVDQHMVDPRVELEQHPLGLARPLQQRVRCARSGRRSRAPPSAPSAPRRRRWWRTRRAAAPRSGARSAGRAGCRLAGPAAPAPARGHAAPARDATFFVASVFSAAARRPSGSSAGTRRAVAPGRPVRAAEPGRRSAAPRSASLAEPCASAPAAASRPAASWLAVGAGQRLQRRRLQPGLGAERPMDARRASPRGRPGTRPGRAAAACAGPAAPSSVSVSVFSVSVTARICSARPSGVAGIAARAQGLRAGLLHQLGRGALVDGLEMRRHAGLEREPPQQGAAQRVDGHDAEPARQLQHLREQAPRPVEPLPVGRRAGQRQQLRRQAGVVGLVAQAASRSSIRPVISAAAALVKVRQRMPSGLAPSSSSRSTRSDSTRVLPVPALAVTQTEAARVGGPPLRRGRRARPAHGERLRAPPLADAGEMLVVAEDGRDLGPRHRDIGAWPGRRNARPGGRARPAPRRAAPRSVAADRMALLAGDGIAALELQEQQQRRLGRRHVARSRRSRRSAPRSPAAATGRWPTSPLRGSGAGLVVDDAEPAVAADLDPVGAGADAERAARRVELTACRGSRSTIRGDLAPPPLLDLAEPGRDPLEPRPPHRPDLRPVRLQRRSGAGPIRDQVAAAGRRAAAPASRARTRSSAAWMICPRSAPPGSASSGSSGARTRMRRA